MCVCARGKADSGSGVKALKENGNNMAHGHGAALYSLELPISDFISGALAPGAISVFRHLIASVAMPLAWLFGAHALTGGLGV